jgi:uncharacterized protein YggE
MKTNILFVFLCISVLLLAGCGGMPYVADLTASSAGTGNGITSAAADSQTTTQPRTISVTGSADVMVVPDEVVLTVGVETNDMVLTKAKNDNDVIVKKVIAESKKLGIEEKYIQTDYISIEPRYQDNYSSKRDFLGFWVRKNIAFTLKDVSKFEDLYSTILENGVNYVYGVEFRTTELRKYRDQARSLAIQAAREKATALATELDQKIGDPLSISENSNYWYGTYSWWGSSAPMTQNVMQNAPSQPMSEAGGTLALGQIAINASVSVTFVLR